MASLPDDVYTYIQSMMHPCPSDLWEPVVHQKLGTIDVYILTEGVYDMDVNFPFTPQDQEMIQPYLNANKRLPLMRFGLCLLKLPNGTNVLLDAGLGQWMTDVKKCSGHPVPEKPPHSLPSLLKKVDLSMQDIDFVVYSHCHGDHVGWTTESSFPNAIHCMHQREYDFATFSGCPWRSDAVQRFEALHQQGKLRLVQGETTVLDETKAPQVSIVLVDGHTPGHVCVQIQDGGESAMYIGDAMHFPLQVEHFGMAPLFDCCAWKIRPFLPFGGEAVEQTWSPAMRKSSTWNATTSAKSRETILQTIVQGDALVLSPHFPPPGMGRVTKKTNGGKFEYKPLES